MSETPWYYKLSPMPVPNEEIIPAYTKIWKAGGPSADTATPEVCSILRLYLPIEYRTVPLWWLQQRLITLRKAGKLPPFKEAELYEEVGG